MGRPGNPRIKQLRVERILFFSLRVLLSSPVFALAGFAEHETLFQFSGLPTGLSIYFQGGEYDPVTGALPISETNVVTGLWFL